MYIKIPLGRWRHFIAVLDRPARHCLRLQWNINSGWVEKLIAGVE